MSNTTTDTISTTICVNVTMKVDVTVPAKGTPYDVTNALINEAMNTVDNEFDCEGVQTLVDRPALLNSVKMQMERI